MKVKIPSFKSAARPLLLIAAIAALALVGPAAASAAHHSPPPVLRHAYPAKGNLPGLRRRMIAGCIPQAGGSDVCPLPAPKQADFCQSPTAGRSFAGCGGGYPAPPTCGYWNVNSYWYGHWWRAVVGGSPVYVVSTFRCTSDFPWWYQQLVNYGIDPHASPGYEWAG